MTATSPVVASATTPRTAPVTVLGLGAMGSTLARTFLEAGHPTTVWNRTPSRADGLVADGAVLAGSVAEAVAASPLVVICVLDVDAVRDLLEPLGDELRDRDVVNVTSTTPEDARDLAAWADQHGVAYLDGAVMVPTPVVGTADAAYLFSGSAAVFERHRGTLASLGGTSEHLGEDAGLASLFDLAMLDVFFAGMTAFLHATALVGADGITPSRFLPYARTIVGVLDEVLPGLAAEVEAGAYPGDDDNIVMELAGMDHIVTASRTRGIDVTVPEVTRQLLAAAVDAGHGRDTFARVIDQLRTPAG